MAWQPGDGLRRIFGGGGAGVGNLPTYKGDPKAVPVYGQMGSPEMSRLRGGASQYGDQYGQALQSQGSALGLLHGAAMGQGPSVAQTQLQQSTDAAIAAQLGAQAAGRGGNMAQIGRQASAVGAGQQMAANQQLATLRAQEMMAAQQAFADQANAQAQLAQAGQMGYEGMLANAQQAQLGTQAQWGIGQRELDIQQREGNRGFGLGIGDRITRAIGGLGGVAGL